MPLQIKIWSTFTDYSKQVKDHHLAKQQSFNIKPLFNEEY